MLEHHQADARPRNRSAEEIVLVQSDLSRKGDGHRSVARLLVWIRVPDARHVSASASGSGSSTPWSARSAVRSTVPWRPPGVTGLGLSEEIEIAGDD